MMDTQEFLAASHEAAWGIVRSYECDLARPEKVEDAFAALEAAHQRLVAAAALPRYQVIYADPPWPYSNEQSGDPARGGTGYPRMEMRDLRALPVWRLAAPDCALFLWTTGPKVAESRHGELFAAWGFRGVTRAFTWIKLNPSGVGLKSGLGYWTNGNAEDVYLGVRGHPKRVAKNVKQVIEWPVSNHSAKPAEVRDRIVQLMGDVPRIELFARERAEGWDATGWDLDRTDIRDFLDRWPRSG